MRRLFFDLGYTAHGGSGLCYDWSVVQDMPLRDAIAFAELLNEQRNEEAKAIERARSKK